MSETTQPSHGYASVRGGKWHRTRDPNPSFARDEQSVCGVTFRPLNVSPAGEPPDYIHESSRCQACEKAAGWAPRTDCDTLLEHRRKLGSRHPRYLIFFRAGDFYEMVGDDAVIAAEVLGVPLRSRNRVGPPEAPLAAVPFHAVEGNLRKLIAAGHKVAICESLPKEAEPPPPPPPPPAAPLSLFA